MIELVSGYGVYITQLMKYGQSNGILMNGLFMSTSKIDLPGKKMAILHLIKTLFHLPR